MATAHSWKKKKQKNINPPSVMEWLWDIVSVINLTNFIHIRKGDKRLICFPAGGFRLSASGAATCKRMSSHSYCEGHEDLRRLCNYDLILSGCASVLIAQGSQSLQPALKNRNPNVKSPKTKTGSGERTRQMEAPLTRLPCLPADKPHHSALLCLVSWHGNGESPGKLGRIAERTALWSTYWSEGMNVKQSSDQYKQI